MYNKNVIERLVSFISSKDGKTDKSRLQNEVRDAFGLVKEVYITAIGLQLDSVKQYQEVLAILY
mgnify:CR=1 FL=1